MSTGWLEHVPPWYIRLHQTEKPTDRLITEHRVGGYQNYRIIIIKKIRDPGIGTDG